MPISRSRVCLLAMLALLGAFQAGAQPWPRRPDAVAGQVDLNHTGANFIDGRGFSRPQEIAVDTSVVPNRVYVFDILNNRVLGWRSQEALTSGAPADLVLGQPNMATIGCNTGGISRQSLCAGSTGQFRAALAVDGNGNVYVGDVENFRILEFDSPFTTDTLADRVLLAPDFATRGCSEEPSSPGGPPPVPCYVSGLAFDRAGNLYVSDWTRGVYVYRQPLTTDTVLDLQIGTTRSPGCTSLDASNFCSPMGLSLDGEDNLYVADSVGRVLVFRSPLTTDGVADLVLGQPDFTTITPCSSAGLGPLPADRLCSPTSVAADRTGNVWVSDQTYNRILGYIAPLATDALPDRVLGKRGSFTSGASSCTGDGLSPNRAFLCSPRAVALDGQGRLWVAESTFNRVLRFSTPFADNALPDLVLGQVDFTHTSENLVDGRGFSYPAAVAIDRANSPARAYVVDARNNRVLGWRDAADLASGQPADLVLGQPDLFSWKCNTGGVSARSLCFTNLFTGGGLALDALGNVYVSDTGNHRILEFDSPFTTDTVADEVFGQGGSFTSAECNRGGVSAASLCSPLGLAVDRQGNLSAADPGNHRVLLYNQPLRKDTVADRVFGQRGSFRNGGDPNRCRGGRDFLCFPMSVAVDDPGNLYIADFGNSRVLQYDRPARSDNQPDRVFGQKGSFSSRLCGLGVDSLCNPVGITVDASGALYVAGSSRVVRYPSPLRKAQTDMSLRGFRTPTAVAVDPAGTLYVTDGDGNRVLVFENP